MRSIYWVIPHFLCGRCGPRQAPWDLGAFRQAGIRTIVSLVDVGLSPVETGAQGIVLHECFLPMTALATPQERLAALKKIQPVLHAVADARQRNEAVLTHCAMGVDRTGLLLACALVRLEQRPPQDAIACVHRANPSALQLDGYQKAVHEFAAMWDPPTKRLKLPNFSKGLTSFIRAEDAEME